MLGGLDRFDFQMSVARLPHGQLLRAIELIGSRVVPRVREQLGDRQGR